MPEGLSPGEVGREIAEHKKHTTARDTEHQGHDRWFSIVEALLLSLVAVLAAYSGFAAAKRLQKTLMRDLTPRNDHSSEKPGPDHR